jgi:3-deoxy-D-arabino-heptulosonate 7-phosphate (DAHP) synthase class II
MLEKLNKAKENVRWLLDHADGNIDFHGLAYWAREVERLREEIKKSL